jgi:hypothetical protein
MKQKDITIAELRRVRGAGFTYKQIEAMSGVPWGTIRSRCRRLGIKPDPDVKVIHTRNRPIKNNHPKWLIEMMYLECKLGVPEIAYELDIPESSAQNLMIRYKIPTRSKVEAAALSRASPYNVQTILTEEMQRKGTQAWADERRRRAARKQRRQERKLQSA